MKIHFVYRKSNPGNYSIESIYDQLLAYWKQSEQNTIQGVKFKLHHTYDIWSFIKAFFASLFGGYRMVHVTGGCNYMVMAFPRSRRILTVHDLYHLSADGISFKGLYRLFYFSLPIRFSHKIVAVSEQTRKDILRHFPNAESKIEVIPNPLHPLFNTKAKPVSIAAKPVSPLHILQIGDKPLKNYENLIKAAHDLNVKFTFVHGQQNRIKALIQKYNITQQVELKSNLTQEELLEAYLKADVLFFASMAEGFGLPLIEAQAVCLPIITSDRVPMNTLAPTAILVDPDSPAAIKRAILQLMEQGVSTTDLKASKEAVEHFQVPRVAEHYKGLYLSLT